MSLTEKNIIFIINCVCHLEQPGKSTLVIGTVTLSRVKVFIIQHSRLRHDAHGVLLLNTISFHTKLFFERPLAGVSL